MKPLVDQQFLLERYEGKGGWTYIRIPPTVHEAKGPFRWVRVMGTIDGVEIKKYHLMPMGDGRLFLPVKAEIRKKIKKQHGDWVHVVLYPDTEPLIVPDEMLICLQDEPKALQFFNSLSESERKYYIDWVYSAKHLETKVRRLTETINRLQRGLKRYQQEL